MAERRPRLSLRSLLIGINLIVLLLPLAGIQLMRIYESALVRQTESALIAQGAFVAAFYRSLVKEQGTRDWLGMSREVSDPDGPLADGQWLPRPAVLDLASSPTLPPFPDGRQQRPAEPFARAVGERMMPMLKDAQLVTLAGIRVVDPWGVIIASTGDDVGMSISHGDEIKLALTGRSASRLRRKSEMVEVSAMDSISRANTVRVFVTSPIIMHGRLIGAVMLSRTPPSIMQALYGKRWLLLQGLVLLVSLVLLMSLLTFRLIARPISRLADQAGRIAHGEMSAKRMRERARPRTAELARLHEAITEMATNLEQRANHLQEFARHVSHEFKTPLASIRGAVEVLQDHANSMDEQQRARFLSNVADDAQRLQRLTERLLDLSRAEMQTSVAAPFDVHAAVTQAAEGFTHQTAIKTAGVDTELRALGDPNLVRAILEVLFENAVQHDAGEVTVWTENADATVQIYVQDNGAGISASNREQIFTPFFTTQRDTGGTGLGLSIALAMVKQIDAELELVSDNGPTTFRLSLGALARDSS